MKLYAIVEIDDDIYNYFKNWYITGDDLNIRYEDEDSLMHYKNIENDLLELKPMPQKLDANEWHRIFSGEYKIREAKGEGYNFCLDEILGEEK